MPAHNTYGMLPGPPTLPLLMLAAALLTSPAVAAQTCEREPAGERPRIGLALGGGGARGLAHIGVLRYLEELRVPIDYIAGTSMGSIVGGLAATGMESDEILAVLEQADWVDLFSDDTAREEQPARRKADDSLGLFGPKLGVGEGTSLLPAGVVSGQKILFLFESITSQRVQSNRFDTLPVPFRAVATDIVNGDMVVITEGSLSGAMRASMAVPGVFDPVQIGQRMLVDGGLVRNLPVDVVREMGAEVVIAVDVGTPLMQADEIRNVLSIVEQMTALAIVANTKAQEASLGERDLLIRPQLGTAISAMDFDKFGEAAAAGYDAADGMRAALAALAVSEPEYGRWRRSVDACLQGPPVVDFVRIDNRSRFADAVIRELVTVEAGQPLDIARLNHDLAQIYGLGFIRLARYRVVEEDGRQGLEIQVLQDERGADFIETGLTLAGNGRGTSINLHAGYLKTDLDPRGTEFRGAIQIGDDFGLLADYYRPLDDRLRYIVNPQLYFARRNLLAFDDMGRALAEAEIDEAGVSLQLLREFGRHAIVGIGLHRYLGTIDITLGPPLGDTHFNGAEWGVDFTYDRLDNLFLPTRGALFDLSYIHSSEALGADANFEQVQSSWLLSKTWGLHNVLLRGRYNTTLDNDAPLYALMTGGGFLNMSGFEPNELVGQHFGMVAAGYRYQFDSSGLWPAYAGMTLEYGNAADRRGDVFGEGVVNGSLYLGYNSPLGPLYLGYGYNEDRSGVVFLQLGAVLSDKNIGRR